MGRRDVIKGALLLTCCALISRSVEFVFRIHYSNLLGPEGMGIFQLIASAHTIMLTVSYGGLSVAVSQLTSKHLALHRPVQVRRVVRTAMLIAGGIGAVAAIAVVLGSGFIAHTLLKEPRTALGLRYIAPSVIMMGVSACIKGYFYASRKVLRPASSEFLEQFVKITGITLLLRAWLPYGLERACAGLALGITIGEMASCSYLCILYRLDVRKIRARQGKNNPVRGTARDILSISLPGAMSSFIGSALRTVESVFIIRGLRLFGLTAGGAVGTYGMVSGMVMPLLIFPLSMLSSVVTTMIPEVSRAKSLNTVQSAGGAIERMLRFTSLFGVMVTGAFMMFGDELGLALYGSSEAGAVIKILCVICPFACMEIITGGILQGMGEQLRLLGYSVMDSFLRITLIFILIPRLGYPAFLSMIVISNLFTFFLVLRRTLLLTGMRFDLSAWLLRPVMASIYAILITRPVLLFLPDLLPLTGKPTLFLCMGLFCAVYLGASVLIKSITRADIAWVKGRGAAS